MSTTSPTRTPMPAHSELEREIARDRADWLLDAIAAATQDRIFLRGDPKCDEVVCQAILLNGEKAIRVAIERAARAGSEG